MDKGLSHNQFFLLMFENKRVLWVKLIYFHKKFISASVIAFFSCPYFNLHKLWIYKQMCACKLSDFTLKLEKGV